MEEEPCTWAMQGEEEKEKIQKLLTCGLGLIVEAGG
jgi:hypothetical protein